MIYNTFYAKLTPNGVVAGIKYSISVVGITAVIDGQKTYDSTPMYFAITPKSSGRATITFKNDTTGEVLGTRQMLVRSLTLANPTYNLTSSATSVNEGGTVTFTLDTTDVPVNSTFAYSITGINAADLETGTLTGSFKIEQNGFARVSFKLKEDQLTEGTETMTLNIASINLSKSVTINDTSLAPTYSVGWYSNTAGTTSVTSVNEGGVVYLVLNTTNIPNGTVFNVTLSGTGITPADFTTGNLIDTITITNNTGYLKYIVTTDRATEGNELVKATVTRNSVSVGTSNLTITDTSLTTTYAVGIYESTTSTTELTTITQNTGGTASFPIKRVWLNEGGAVAQLGYSIADNPPTTDNIYYEGIKLNLQSALYLTNFMGVEWITVLFENNLLLSATLSNITVKLTNTAKNKSTTIVFSWIGNSDLFPNGGWMKTWKINDPKPAGLLDVWVVDDPVTLEVLW